VLKVEKRRVGNEPFGRLPHSISDKGGGVLELTERKQKILRAVVDLYISTAEPVGSKTVSALPDMSFSSATIRNEMAELTTLGFLEQPHTSAGRIPSAAGYRFYIDRLMNDYRLSVDETQSLSQEMELRLAQFDKALNQVGKLISKVTNLPAYAMTARRQRASVRRFELLQADEKSFILVVMLTDESVHNKLIKLPLHVTQQDLKLLSAVLNASLTELTSDEVTPELIDRVTRSAGEAASLVPVVVDFVTHVLDERQRGEVYVTGQTRLLGQPEYRDLSKAQEVLGALDEDTISNLPAKLDPNSPMQILVGPENVAQELKDTSVVVTRFDIGDGMQGMIGVVGPQRMDYALITARLSYFAEGLGRMFGKPELPDAKEKTEE
jgi:heat-inducible transcriptional repressor